MLFRIFTLITIYTHFSVSLICSKCSSRESFDLCISDTPTTCLPYQNVCVKAIRNSPQRLSTSYSAIQKRDILYVKDCARLLDVQNKTSSPFCDEAEICSINYCYIDKCNY